MASPAIRCDSAGAWMNGKSGRLARRDAVIHHEFAGTAPPVSPPWVRQPVIPKRMITNR
jgi:hypothetical protein